MRRDHPLVTVWISDEATTVSPKHIGDRHQYSASVGARVGAVLTTAEKAAEEIVRLARDEARDLLRQAESDAEAMMRRRKQEAEEEAQRITDAARSDAEEIRRAAEEDAADTERTSRRRWNRVEEETRLLRERVEWARQGLSEIVGRLESVAPDQSPWETSSAEPGEAETDLSASAEPREE